MDQLTQIAVDLGSSNLVVLTMEDYERLGEVVARAGVEGFLSEEERLAISLMECSAWTCPGAVRA